MSVSRLSELDPTPEHEKVQQSYTPPPGSTDESKLDAIVSKAFEQVESQYEDHPQERDLDKLISKSIEKHETRVADESATGAAYDRR